ncbi:MAG TPA: hypothetical protein VKR83_00220 [Ktedonobacteraceae bacterium]|nr:hypothetical protein [Ktedonobacteraceae bacterium]
MLIVNDHHRLLAGVASLNDPCPYCSQPLRSYPLILADDAAQTAYHAACAVARDDLCLLCVLRRCRLPESQPEQVPV